MRVLIGLLSSSSHHIWCLKGHRLVPRVEGLLQRLVVGLDGIGVTSSSETRPSRCTFLTSSDFSNPHSRKPYFQPVTNTRSSADTGSKPSDIENKVTVSAFARRRLAVVMVRLKMAESVSDVSPRSPSLPTLLTPSRRRFAPSNKATSVSVPHR